MNALAKYTLGPWRIGDAGKTVFGPFTASPCPVTVARMPEASPRCGVDERKANALLIAAAPEMAAALLALVGQNATTSLCIHKPKDCFGRVMGTWSEDAAEAGRVALRKAGLLS